MSIFFLLILNEIQMFSWVPKSRDARDVGELTQKMLRAHLPS